MKMVRDTLEFILLFSAASTFAYFRIVNGLLYHNHKFTRPPEFHNNVCSPQDIVMTTTLDSAIHCAATCTRVSTCRSSMFNKDTKECILCRGPFSSSNELSPADGYRFYSDQTRNYHMGCTSTTDCNEMNNVCEFTTGNVQLCVCTPGYSYQPGAMTCEAGCSSYGSTYEMYLKYYMEGLNNDVRDGASLQFCKDFCASRTGYTCRSFERENNKCWFSSQNALTKPSSYKKLTGTQSDFYNRNCA